MFSIEKIQFWEFGLSVQLSLAGSNIALGMISQLAIQIQRCMIQSLLRSACIILSPTENVLGQQPARLAACTICDACMLLANAWQKSSPLMLPPLTREMIGSCIFLNSSTADNLFSTISHSSAGIWHNW